jgi:hypothetical protein
VLERIYQGISQPDIAELFRKLAAAASYGGVQLTRARRTGERGLMRFLQLDLAMGEMTRQVPDAGSYALVTILVQETGEGGTRVAYDTVASALDTYRDPAALAVADKPDGEVLALLRQATGATAPAGDPGHPNT